MQVIKLQSSMSYSLCENYRPINYAIGCGFNSNTVSPYLPGLWPHLYSDLPLIGM